MHTRSADVLNRDDSGVLQDGQVLRDGLPAERKTVKFNEPNNDLEERLTITGNEFVDYRETHRVAESLEYDVHSPLLATFWLPVNPDKLETCPAMHSATSFPVG